MGNNNWTDWAGGASAVFVAVQAAMKIYQRARIWFRPAREAHGITIMNGDAKALLEAIGRIEARQDRHGRTLEQQSQAQQEQAKVLAGHTKSLDSLAQRTGIIEQRLSTLS